MDSTTQQPPDLTQELLAKAQAFQAAYETLCQQHGFVHRAELQNNNQAIFASLMLRALPPTPPPQESVPEPTSPTTTE